MMIDVSIWFKAACDGDEETLREAMVSGFDVNIRDEKLNTALHHATKQGHLNIMHLLIGAGADVDLQNL